MIHTEVCFRLYAIIMKIYLYPFILYGARGPCVFCRNPKYGDPKEKGSNPHLRNSLFGFLGDGAHHGTHVAGLAAGVGTGAASEVRNHDSTSFSVPHRDHIAALPSLLSYPSHHVSFHTSSTLVLLPPPTPPLTMSLLQPLPPSPSSFNTRPPSTPTLMIMHAKRTRIFSGGRSNMRPRMRSLI